MTDIAVESTTFQVGKRAWLIPQPGGIGFGYSPSGTVDAALFTAATHFPNGYLLSGIVLAQNTTTKRLGPYTPGATNGLQTPVGFLFQEVPVRTATSTVGVAYVAAFAVVNPARLPLTSGAGSLDSAAQTALRTIHFVPAA